MAVKRLQKKNAQEERVAPTTPEETRALLEKLQVSETRYRRLFETAQDGILLLDAKTGKITDANPFLLDLLGYSYKGILGKQLWEIGLAEDEAGAERAFETLQTNGYIRYENLPLRTTTGTTIQVEFVSNRYSVGGEGVIQCNIRDIAQRKLVEDVARGRNVGKDFALEVGELGAWRLDLASGTAWRSPRHDQIFGYPTLLPEWTYEMFLGHVLAEDRDAVAESFGRAISSKTDWDCTCRIRRKDGEIRWVWAKGRPELGKRGEPVAVYGLVQDITERELARQETEILARFSAENPDPVLRVARDGEILYANPPSEPLLHLWNAARGGYVPADWRERIAGDVLRPGGRETVEVECDDRVYSVIVAPVVSGGYVNLYGRDVTELRKAEAERELALERQLVLNRITLSLGAATSLETTLRTLHNEVRVLLDADGFFVSQYHEDTGLITALFVVDEGVERDVSTFPPIPLAPEGEEMQSQVLRTGQPLNVPNWIERERTMQTVSHIASNGALTGPPFEDEREGCTKSALVVPMMLQGRPVGVLQVQSNRLNAYSDEDVELLAGVANVAAISIQDALLVEKVRRGLEGTIEALARTTEMRDPYTAGHQRRVSQLACAIAEKMGLAGKMVESLRVSGLLHDVGKVSIPAEILSKPSALTPLEFSLVQEHVRIGFDILQGITLPWPVAEIVLEHHERLDGSGYPRGLKGDAIMLGARILAVADVVEAMGSLRPYRAALGIDAALEEIREHQGKLYDSDVVEACIQLFGDGFEFARTGAGPSP